MGQGGVQGVGQGLVYSYLTSAKAWMPQLDGGRWMRQGVGQQGVQGIGSGVGHGVGQGGVQGVGQGLVYSYLTSVKAWMPQLDGGRWMRQGVGHKGLVRGWVTGWVKGVSKGWVKGWCTST